MSGPIWDTAEQGTAGWLKARCGCLTASRMAEAMDFLKGGKESKARAKFKIELLAERLTDSMVERFVTDAMRHGIECEPLARDKYEELSGEIVQACGFAQHGEIPFFGASPDGLVGNDGLLEIKCPTSSTYLEWYLDGDVPEQHKPQMLAQLAVTGRKWVDFVAFDPRLPENVQYFQRRFEPGSEEIKAVEEAATAFLNEIETMWDKMMGGNHV